MMPLHEVVVVGAGPAGLSAALVLARSRHQVLVLDSGRPRNAAAQAVHAFLTRDGVEPLELRRFGRRDLRRYGVTVRRTEVERARRRGGEFELELRGGRRLRAHALVLATGVRDRLPEVPGLRELYGMSVHHCPFCDGWESRDRALAVYGRGKAGYELALKLTAWSRDVALFSDGPSGLKRERRRLLRVHGIPLYEQRVGALEGRGGRLGRIRLADGTAVPRQALFLATGADQSCDLALQLGCVFTRQGRVRTKRGERTGVPLLYVAGDASHDVQLAVLAAAEGVKAAVYLHSDLDEERRRGLREGASRRTGRYIEPSRGRYL
jgi:thioredoxin reductase